MTKQKLQNLLHGMLIGLGIHETTVPTSAYTDRRAEFFGSCKRINRLAQPRARYREELAKRKSEPTNSIPTECRKAQPVRDQTFYLPGHIFNFLNPFYFRQQFFRTHRTTIAYSMSQLNIKQQQSVVQINYSRLLPICHQAVTKKCQQNCQQL